MIAYKFLKSGAIAAFTGSEWRTGTDSGLGSFPWLHASDGPLDPCRNGIHAATPEQLIYWLDAELWQIELAGEVVQAPQSIVARSGRLLRRIDTWGDRTPLAIGRVCVDRVRGRILAAGGAAAISEAARDYAREAEAFVGRGDGVVAAYAAALAGAALEPGADMDGAFHAERRAQSLLLARIVGVG